MLSNPETQEWRSFYLFTLPIISLGSVLLIMYGIFSINNYLNSTVHSVHHWAHDFFEKENYAIKELSEYLANQNSRDYQEFLTLIGTLNQRIATGKKVLNSNVERIQAVTTLTKRYDFTHTEAQKRVFTLRMLTSLGFMHQEARKWQTLALNADSLKEWGRRIHRVLQTTERNSPHFQRLIKQWNSFKSSILQRHKTFHNHIHEIKKWYKSTVNYSIVGLILLLFAGGVGLIKYVYRKTEKNYQKWRQLFTNSPVPLVYVNDQAHVQEVNHAFTELFGYTNEDIEHQSIDNMLAPEEKSSEAKRISKAAQAGNSLKKISTRRDTSGELKHVIINTIPVSTKDKEVIGHYCIYQDISDLVESKQKLQASLEEKQTLLEEIHHRVKNNLAVISSLLFMQAETTKDEKTSENLKKAQSRIHSMAKIHEQLYQQAENKASIDVSRYLPELAENIINNHRIGETNINTKVEVDEVNIPLDQAIPMGLIVSELIINACRHAFTNQQKGTIEIKLVQEDDTVRLVINDNGKGFSKDRQSADQSIGLTVIQKLIEQLDGEIDFQTEGEGGARFDMTFPLNNA